MLIAMILLMVMLCDFDVEDDGPYDKQMRGRVWEYLV